MDSSTKKTKERAIICLGAGPLDPEALRFVAKITESLQITPVLCHVADKGETPGQVDSLLQAAQASFTEQEAQLITLNGNRERAILNRMEEAEFCLLVLGTSDFPLVSPLTALTMRLMKNSSSNLLLIEDPPETLNSILIGTAGHTVSVLPARIGVQLAKLFGAQVTFLHVTPQPPSMYTGLPSVDNDLADVLARETPLANHLKELAAMADSSGVKAQIQLRHGMVAEEIVRACESAPYDLVVLGVAPSGWDISRWMRDDIAALVLASVRQSFLIVRTELVDPTDSD